MTLKRFDLTCVEYEDGSITSFVLALSQMAPVFIFVGLCTVCIFRRELHLFLFLVGQLADTVLNRILKVVIKQPRPNTSSMQDYGMPSNHSEFVFFFAAYLALLLIFRYRKVSRPWKTCVGAAAFIAATMASYARVHFGHHTNAQVMWGGIVGVAFACIWYGAEASICQPYFYPEIESWRLSKYFYLRDVSTVDNVLQIEYNAVQEHKKKKSSNNAKQRRR